MPEDFNFFDDPSESPSSSPAPAPAPSADPPAGNGDQSGSQSVSLEQFTDLQKRLENAERWRQDVGRMISGEPQQQQQQQVDPQQLLAQFLTNPHEVLQNTTQQAVNQAQEAYRQEAIIQDRRSKHPELAQVEHLIDWNGVMQNASQSFYQANNRAPSFAEALDGAIGLVKSRFPGAQPGAQTQNGSGQRVMNMDISGNANAGNSRPIDLSTIPDAEWPKYRDAYRRSQGI